MIAIFTLFLGACQTEPVKSPPHLKKDASPNTSAQKTKDSSTKECTELEILRANYRKARVALNHCTHERDCTQIWPGACPEGPYFIHANADATSVFEMERTIEACSNIECEPPIVLKSAGCIKGKCVANARTAVPSEQPLGSCWDTPIRYIANQGVESESLQKYISGSSPLLIYEATAEGVLLVKTTWPKECTDCILKISKHNSGMANLIVGKRRKNNNIEEITIAIKPGPYYFVGLSEKTKGSFLMQITHKTDDGTHPTAGAHGFGLRRFCEG